MLARSPMPSWLKEYRRGSLRGDLVAGVTIAAYLIPQVMAYAELAGLPAVSGLWACVGALLLYGLLGTSRQLSVGPESTTALMTAAAASAAGVEGADRTSFAAALALAVAVICVLAWCARVSVLAELFSRPVLVGYMTGVAVIMMVSQLGALLGISARAEGFAQELANAARHLGDVQAPTLALGAATTAAMIVGSTLFRRAPIALLGILAATAVAAVLRLDSHGVRLVGDIPAGLPQPGVPPLGSGEILTLIGPALGVAFVGYADNVLTARAFASRRGERIDARRELLALGAANLGAGLMHGFPVSSSGSRTTIGNAAGSRTQLTGYVTLAATLVAIVTARPVLEAIPAAALAAVVVYAATQLVDVRELRRLGRFRTSELVLALATTAAVLAAGVLWGVLVAVGLSVLDLLRRVARPHDAVGGLVPGLAGMHDVDDYPSAEVLPGVMIYRYDSPLFFANAEDFRTRALAAVASASVPVEWFVLNAEAIVEVDITAVDALESLRNELADRGIAFALARVKQDLLDELEPSGLLDRIGRDRLFPTLPTALAAFEHRAGPAT